MPPAAGAGAGEAAGAADAAAAPRMVWVQVVGAEVSIVGELPAEAASHRGLQVLGVLPPRAVVGQQPPRAVVVGRQDQPSRGVERAPQTRASASKA